MGNHCYTRSRRTNRIRQAASKDKNLKFNNLYHHLTLDLLIASFLDLKRQAAPGVDDMTWSDNAEDYEGRIIDLHKATPPRKLQGPAE